MLFTLSLSKKKLQKCSLTQLFLHINGTSKAFSCGFSAFFLKNFSLTVALSVVTIEYLSCILKCSTLVTFYRVILGE